MTAPIIVGDATLLTGNALDVLRELPDQSVHCCVTSPPYYGLRDYGVDGQLGLEDTLVEYIENMVEVFREVRRVLRDDGTLWLNIGDSYAGARRGSEGDKSTLEGTRANQRESRKAMTASRRRDNEPIPRSDIAVAGMKPKDMLMVPARLAIALQADGWYVRQDIIWRKPNPMPESVRDRCTKAHEYLFLLAKSQRYYFDQEAMREDRRYEYDKPVGSWREGEGVHSSVARCVPDVGGATKYKYKSGNKRRKPRPGAPAGHAGAVAGSVPWEGTSRNRRSVWDIATESYAGAHFATFPRKLIEPCILAGCPPGGTVLDPFSGSGTAGMVALEQGRKYIGIDLNPEYHALAVERIAPADAQPRMFA